MQDMTDLAVTPDGKVVVATTWDEGGTNAAVFQDDARRLPSPDSPVSADTYQSQ